MTFGWVRFISRLLALSASVIIALSDGAKTLLLCSGESLVNILALSNSAGEAIPCRANYFEDTQLFSQSAGLRDLCEMKYTSL